MSASLIPPITTAAAPAAPKIGFPTVNPTIAPTTPRQIATIRRAFGAELLPVPRVSSWYPHDGQLTAVSEIDLPHSGHAIKPIPVLLFLARTGKITRLPPKDFDLRKRPNGNLGAFFCSAYPRLSSDSRIQSGSRRSSRTATTVTQTSATV
jgi:hypothetical protein